MAGLIPDHDAISGNGRGRRQGSALFILPELLPARKVQHVEEAVVRASVDESIREMSSQNVLRGAPRLHRELLNLGIQVSQSAVAECILKVGLCKKILTILQQTVLIG